MDAWTYLAIGVAAFVAGGVNSIAGGGSVITFPVLLWSGIPPVVASATNSLGLWPGVISALFGYRAEMTKSTARELFLLVPSVVGGLVGALVLLETPPRYFKTFAPGLVLLATVLIALQEPVSRTIRGRSGHRSLPTGIWIIAGLAQLGIAIYGGYFGAGMGILMLATLGFVGSTDIHHMNALKNLFAIGIKGSAIVYLLAEGAIDGDVAWVMVAASTAGGFAGAKVAYRLGQPRVRRVIIAIGFLMALSLLFRN